MLHVEGIKDGFLSSLGKNVLALVYRAIDEAEECVLIVELKSDRVIGFVAGGAEMGPIYKRMLRRLPQLAVALAPQLVSPRKLRGLFEIMSRRDTRDDDGILVDLPKAELLSIVVAPDMRGRGLAERLYQALKEELSCRGFDAFRIMVGGRLHPAHRFYKRMGAEAQFTGTFHKGERSVIYVQRMAG